MKVFHKLEDVPSGFGPSVASVGNFDGVHKAHQLVLRQVVVRARELNAQAVAVTFDPHPAHILRPDIAPKLITPLPLKLKLLDDSALDAALSIPFSRALPVLQLAV